MFRFFLFLLLLTAGVQVRGQIVISEIMGDPGFLGDREGEYLELVNISDEAVGPDSAGIVVNEKDTLVLEVLALHPRQVYLICRDSAAMASAGSSCNVEWAGLNISNSKEILVALFWAESRRLFKTGAPRAGRSWENTLDASREYGVFTVAEDSWLGQDFGSPGFLHSGVKLAFNRDLSLRAAFHPEKNEINFTLTNSGSRSFPKPSITIHLDLDWDGMEDVMQDSAGFDFELAPGAAHSFKWRVPPGAEGLFIGTTGEDENLRNNRGAAFVPPQTSLMLTEVCANPAEDAPEWVEIQNASAQILNLDSVRLHGMPLSLPGAAGGRVLKAGEYLVAVADKKAFEDRHGSLKLFLVEPISWHVLKNTGDTVTLKAFGQTLDSMHYGSLKVNDKGRCLTRDRYNPGVWRAAAFNSPQFEERGEASSPGYESPQDSVFDWSVSDKILDISNSAAYLVFEMKSPASIRYSLRIYDLSGYEVRRLCTDCSGSRKLKWNGKDDSGRVLSIGPYVVWVKVEGAKPKKRVVVLAKPL